MKCGMTDQTEVTLDNMGHASNLIHHIKVTWVGLEKYGCMTFIKNLMSHGQQN